MKIKISSIIDVITNSSTEVFTLYNEKSLDEIKKLFEAICELDGTNLKFDDLFDFRFVINCGYLEERLVEWAEDNQFEGGTEKMQDLIWKDKNDEIEEIVGYEKLLKMAKEYDEEAYEGYAISGVDITPKEGVNFDKEKIEKVSKILSDIDNIFSRTATYC